MSASAPLTYVLSGRERFRWNVTYRWRARPGEYLVAGCTFAGSSFGLLMSDRGLVAHGAHDAIAMAVVRYGLVVVALFAIGWAIAIVRALRRSDRLTLELTRKGIDLNCNGDAQCLAWYAVKGAYAFEDFYAIERRDDVRRPILIPKAALTDSDAVWSDLEQRLHGAPKTIRRLGFAPSTHLMNNHDQFLTDHATP